MNIALLRVFFSLPAATFFKPKQSLCHQIDKEILLKPSLVKNMSSSLIFSSESTILNDEVDCGNTKVKLIKSENDFMAYRLIQLNNGLKAILVSDVQNIVDLKTLASEESDEENSSGESEPEFESHDRVENFFLEEEDLGRAPKSSVKEPKEKMAACALCVGVGSFSDPPEIPGLAHFLEHMVFMGSNKYPKENGFDEFIKKHGGSDNGSTECETTTFYLECNEKYLKEGMDRFAQFFISPLMKKEAMARETEAIHSEFEMSLPSDGTRREQILGSFAPSGHPAAKFLWGNTTTLSTNIGDIDLHARVHEFRERHYSAHRMTLAVQGRLPLDTLEYYVRNSFSDIPCNNLPPDDFSSYIGTFGFESTFNKMVWVKPVRDICQVHLTWVLPSYMKEYKSRPLDYVAWLIGHEGEGSLLLCLRKKVWALECEAGNDESGFENNSIYSLFSISLTLTEEGYEHMNEVIFLVFSYISMLKRDCPNESIYKELHTVCETNFRYKIEIPSASYVEILAESMHIYEPEHYIAGGELYFQYEPDLIRDVVKYLTGERVNLIIYSKDHRDGFYDRVEPWFQTKYKIQDIPAEWMKNWMRCSVVEDFHIPRPNPYLTTDFSLIPGPKENPLYPKKIINDSLLEIWYRQDLKFKQPLAYFSFNIVSPILKTDPVNTVLLDVLLSYLDKKFTEQIFSANQAGLYCTYDPSDLGMLLQFSGYSQKLPLLFDEILKLIFKCCTEINHEESKKLFQAIKKGRSRAYYNRIIKPRKLIKMARLSILMDNYYTAVECLNVMNQVTPQKLYEFAFKFFHNVKIMGLIQGNVSQKQCIEMCEKFQTVLHCSPLRGEKPHIRVTKLKLGELILRLKSFSEGDNNSVIVNYYQVGEANIRTSCLIDLLMMAMDEPLFDSLRTKQQIGYDVHCLLRDTFGILGFSITVFFQSNKFSPDEVDERIEEFLKTFSRKLKAMSKKEWGEMKLSLCLLKSGADLHLQDEVKRNFAEICAYDYFFDRLQREMETIPEISHRELCHWFTQHIASGKFFRKLSVQVVGSTTEESLDSQERVVEKSYRWMPMESEGYKKDLFITNISNYKDSREFYPVRKKNWNS